MTSVVASIIERTVSEASESARAAFRQGADLVELRLDWISGLDLSTIREARREILGPTIATLRSKAQGGRSLLTGEKRRAILEETLQSDFEYVDLELDADKALLKKAHLVGDGPELIASVHFREPVSRDQVEKKLREALALGDIGKVAMPCDSATHALMLSAVGHKYSSLKKRCVVIGMGDQGQLTRVFADEMGSELVYACLKGKEAAPGQLEVETQTALLKPSKMVFGLIGHPVSHSVSKPMQEEALSRLGLAGAYLPLDILPKEFDGNSLRAIKAAGFVGLNVTIPHKATAFKLCDKWKEAASETGAANTILFVGRDIVGENTDVIGFSRLLDGKINIMKSTGALVIGAGGAAKAVTYVLTQRQARVTVTDIENERAVALAKKFGAHSIAIKKLWKSRRPFDLVVNCSPSGMKGVGGIPIKATFLGPGSVYVDAVYNPPVTRAMQIAETRGARAYGGLEMLVQQGAESFRLWTGMEPNVEAMREAARRALD